MLLRFGKFELNVSDSELFRDGHKVDIQAQPLRIIALLVQHAGEVVTREELRERIWPGDTFVDFESGLKTAIKKARQALGDDATNPRFIETLPRQGYRFIAPVSYIIPDEQQRSASDTKPVAVEPPSRARRPPRWILIALFGGAALLVAVTYWWTRSPQPPILDHLRPFTNNRGRQAHPTFSPDGQTLAFDWRGPGDQHSRVYLQRLDAVSAVPFSPGNAEELRPVWSGDGAWIAFLRYVDADTWGIFGEPLVGSESRKFAEFHRGASAWFDWSVDGKWFVVAEPPAAGEPPGVELISTANGERRFLTHPAAGWRGDSVPVFSPDSSKIYFRRTRPESSAEDIYEMPVTGGTPERLTFDNRMIVGYGFTRDGGLLFSSRRIGAISSLWWLPATHGSLKRVTSATFDAVSPAVSRDGKHVAFVKSVFDVNIWSMNADGSGTVTPLIDSALPDTSPQFSTDGRRLVFESMRSGASDVWVSDVNGANALRLTDGRGVALGNPRWSPDGKQIAFEWHPGGKSDVYLVSSDGGGTPHVLTPDRNQNSMPAWSHDGRYLYVSSDIDGNSTLRRLDAKTGAATVLLTHDAQAPSESPDGRFLYYFASNEIWKIALKNAALSGPSVRVVGGLQPQDWGNWVPTNDGVYYVRRKGDQYAAIEFQAADGSAARIVHVLQKPPLYGGRGLAVSPDGKTLLFAQVDEDDANIFVQ